MTSAAESTPRPTCPTCGHPLLIVTNHPGRYLCRWCRSTVDVADVAVWRAEAGRLRIQQRDSAIATMRIWRADADHVPEAK